MSPNDNSLFDGLSLEAKKLAEELVPQIRGQIARIESIPIAVLIWGPNPTSSDPVAQKRVALRTLLRSDGHWACFSEELIDEDSKVDIRIQQICQAENFDLIISIPAISGSIGEIHEFVRDEILRKKITVFINEQWDAGYSNQSLRGSAGTGSYRIISYNQDDC